MLVIAEAGERGGLTTAPLLSPRSGPPIPRAANLISPVSARQLWPICLIESTCSCGTVVLPPTWVS